MYTLPAALDRCSYREKTRSLSGVLNRALSGRGLVLALVGVALLGGCDSSRFLDPSAVVKAPNNMSPVRPIDLGLSPADYALETVPNSAPPTEDDLIYKVVDYVLGPTDVVDITVLDLYEPNQEALLRKEVSGSGYIDLPLVGMIKAEGLTANQLKQAVINAYSPDILRNPTVSVAIVAERQNTYSALGAVARPGTYNITRNDMRLLEALALSGGIIQTNIRYIYVIRPAPAVGIQAAGATTVPTTTGPAIPELPELPALPTLPNLPSLPTLPESSKPAATPAPSPSSPPAASVPSNSDAALKELTDALRGTSSRPAETMPRYSFNSDGQAVPEPATATAPAPDEAELRGAIKNSKWVYVAGQGWVRGPADAASQPGETTAAVPATEPGAGVAGSPAAGPVEGTPTLPALPPAGQRAGSPNDPFGWHKMDKTDQARIISINLRKLQEGDPRMNIVVHNSDIIMVPPLEMGEFYVMGEVQRPGVYSLSGRRVTVKMAIAAAGNLGPLSYPKNTILIRRMGDNQEQIFPIDVEAIYRGEENDIFLKPDDVIAVGQCVLSPFMLVVRNAFRMTYGFGFIWDRNFADPLPQASFDSRRFHVW